MFLMYQNYIFRLYYVFLQTHVGTWLYLNAVGKTTIGLLPMKQCEPFKSLLFTDGQVYIKDDLDQSDSTPLLGRFLKIRLGRKPVSNANQQKAVEM